MIGETIMSLIDRSPILAGLTYAKGQVLTRLKLRGHHSGSTALSMSVDDAADYARRVVADYVTYGAGGDAERLIDKDVLEIGPGDNLGVALLLLAKGARTVTCIDGFAHNFNAHHNSQVYKAIYSSLGTDERERVRDVLTIQADGSAAVGGERLLCRYGVPIDAEMTPLRAHSYDIVISRAVLEHLGDLEIGWRNMVQCLRKDGEMWHKVDFRCHDFFGQIHPLYFLTVSDTIWNFISRPDPTMNRLRHPTYRELASRYFYHSRFYITHLAGESEFFPHPERLVAGMHYGERQLDTIRDIRPRLLRQFADYDVEDLLVTGVFLTSRGVRSNQESVDSSPTG
jgi:SAM-dependent methyltransferase